MAKRRPDNSKNRIDRNAKSQSPSKPPQKEFNLFSTMIFALTYIVVLLILLEIVARAFLWFDMGVGPSDLIYKYYPTLKEVEESQYESGSYDILILGASVIAKGWTNGGIQTVLAKKLADQGARHVRIYNLATPAHTTLDSYYKYKHLINRKFDLVVIYDSINDTRANNCPLKIYRDDYSHYAWYEELNLLDQHKEIKYLVFPYEFHKLAIRIWKSINHIEYVPKTFPKKEWIQYGVDIKTKVSFKNNLEKIIELAGQKGEKILLMTFAYYVPKDYSYEKFKSCQLDYTFLEWSAPIEEWGAPANVVKGIDAHNEVIKELAREHKDVLLVDQASLMPHSGTYFRDICHLTPAGFDQFVDNFYKVVLKNIPTNNGL